MIVMSLTQAFEKPVDPPVFVLMDGFQVFLHPQLEESCGESRTAALVSNISKSADGRLDCKREELHIVWSQQLWNSEDYFLISSDGGRPSILVYSWSSPGMGGRGGLPLTACLRCSLSWMKQPNI